MSEEQRKIKILCVDDEPELLEIMKKTVAELGHEVLTAYNVDDAMILLRQEAHRMCLVLSDFSMGEKTGFDLRKSMLDEFKHIPFVLVSGQVSKEYALEAIELKISAFLAKPFHDHELLKTVAEQSKDRVAVIRDDDELRAGFIQESKVLIEEMEELILNLEENPTNTEWLDRVFACAHTIKGTSGFFKPNIIHQYMHKYEDFLSAYKKGKNLNSSAIQVLLNGLDQLKGLLKCLDSQSIAYPDLKVLIAIFDNVTETSAVSEKLTDTAPSNSIAPPKEELRVAVRVLNDFMEKSGEITVLRNMVNKTFRSIELSYDSDPNIIALADLMEEMHRSIAGMQDQVADLKKISVSHIVKPLSRTLRDLTVNLGKKIRLDITGGELRIDHCLSEALGKCLIHLLRNSVDHGIETPEKRKAIGKPESGTITIAFNETAEEVIVSISDDGKGIDLDVVKKKALEKGIVTASDLARKSEAEIRMLIFAPGFSTAQEVTDVSGRGVGTDMVRQVVQILGGKIELNSKLGQGTQFILKLPIPKSAMIINSLMIRSAGETYAIPQDRVARIIDLSQASSQKCLKTIGALNFYLTEEGIIPIVALEEVFRQKTSSPEVASGFLVSVDGEKGRFCLQVQEVLETEDIVVKSMPNWFRGLKIFKGATFLGDGKVGLILDVDGILESKGTPPVRATVKEAEVVATNKNKHYLLTFFLNDRSMYALPQKDIVRIERVEAASIKWSGKQARMLYGKQSLLLISLKNLLAKTHSGDLDSKENNQVYDVIVTRASEQRLVGYIVDKIEDLIEFEGSSETLFHVANHPVHVINGHTITVLNLKLLEHTIESAHRLTEKNNPRSVHEKSVA